jgi:hypothetical protein
MRRSGPGRAAEGLACPYLAAVAVRSRSHCRPLSLISRMLRVNSIAVRRSSTVGSSTGNQLQSQAGTNPKHSPA